jgi:hypothetical protein
MFASQSINRASAKALLTCAALLMLGFAFLGANNPASAQSRQKYPEVKNPTPDGKDCYKHKGKRYCAAKNETGPSGKLADAPKDPQALKDCWWFKGRLYCIYYNS